VRARSIIALVALASSGCLLSQDGPCKGGGVRVPPDYLCECPDGSVQEGSQCIEADAAGGGAGLDAGDDSRCDGCEPTDVDSGEDAAAESEAANATLDAQATADATQVTDANDSGGTAVDAAAADASPASTCGDFRVDDNREECEPTVPGWSRWTCTSECRVSRAYNVCGTDTDCGAGTCLFGACRRMCTSTSECPLPIVNTGVRPICLPGVAWLSPPIPQMCALIGCAVDSDCPPYQACSQPVMQGEPWACVSRVCATNSDCPTGVCRSTSHGLFCMAPL
jgi:hypothetical protein